MSAVPASESLQTSLWDRQTILYNRDGKDQDRTPGCHGRPRTNTQSRAGHSEGFLQKTTKWVLRDKQDGPSDKRECPSTRSNPGKSHEAGENVTSLRDWKQPSEAGASMGRGSAGMWPEMKREGLRSTVLTSHDEDWTLCPKAPSGPPAS